jgi:transcriptional regulator EpsA
MTVHDLTYEHNMSPDKFAVPASAPASASRAFHPTAEESEKFLRVVAESLAIQRHYHLLLWLNGELQDFLPHEVLIAACGDFAAKRLKLEIVSALPGMRTSELAHGSIDAFVEDLHARWVRGDRRPIVLRSAEVRALLGPGTCHVHSVLSNMHSILVHGVRDLREGRDNLYVATNQGSFTKGWPEDRFLALLSLLVPQIDFAFRGIAALPPAAKGGKAQDGCNRLALSMREQEVLNLLCRGKANFDIAQELDISPFTVQNHLKRIFKKIGVNNRTLAATKYTQALNELRNSPA